MADLPSQSEVSAANGQSSAEGFTTLDGREVYRIAAPEAMPPFLMSLVSDTDLWMYVSSAGGLSAGRANANASLFPYETDDKLHRAYGITGPITLMRIRRLGQPTALWAPLAAVPAPGVRRKLYKSPLGDWVVFEESNPALGLTFRYSWAPAGEFGFVRQSTLTAHDDAEPADVELLDGLLNILPAGVDVAVQQQFSCLLNAYAQSEADPTTRLAIFAMASRIVDRAEPAEALVANVAWSLVDRPARIFLTNDRIAAFRSGTLGESDTRLNGRRGAYLLSMTVPMVAGHSEHWSIVADVGRDHLGVADLQARLADPEKLGRELAAAVVSASEGLAKLVARADGLQDAAERSVTAHHAANVLFNNMRGGVFAGNYDVAAEDFRAFVLARNARIYEANRTRLAAIPSTVAYSELVKVAEMAGSPDLYRLTLEYLPLSFSRRHGDPSRPWNQFNIRVRNPDGSQVLDYQGNWRDIFQNWEAMCLSFPSFLESVIAKFVNASTPDGFNPYRISRDGIDWEVPEPHNPWANIGYWGDHQIVYLLRLLEASRNHHPNGLRQMLGRSIFSYADVPYRLKSYEELLADRWNTIVFDAERNRLIDRRVKEFGADGKLLLDPTGGVYHVTLTEKLLVPALCKLSNLIAGGGIWMNTQRPEWNDANNALVGNGISVVTLCYLRRYVAFCAELFAEASDDLVPVSGEVIDWLEAVRQVLSDQRGLLARPTVSSVEARRLTDSLGKAFCAYRAGVYANGFHGRRLLSHRDASAFLGRALEYLDHSIAANRRDDGLYHSYNLLDLPDSERLEIGRLQEMLEGQVAALGSGALSAVDALKVTDALTKSAIYRADQHSFMLYPERALPSFHQKNDVPASEVQINALLLALLEAGNTAILARDALGHYRFNGAFRNAATLLAALDVLARDARWQALVVECREATLATFERVFNHRSFTGRSGGMYGYEGLGCIYWHMVSKLLLAVQECYRSAARSNQPAKVVRALADTYYRVREGLGYNKTAAVYGAFPIDPYSHTPRHAGAQQPGMTGQVKEEIITRFGELGVIVAEGIIEFDPSLLRRREFLTEPRQWTYYDLPGVRQTLTVPAGGLAFTICQTPVIYQLGDGPWKTVSHKRDGSSVETEGHRLPTRAANSIWQRRGDIARLHVSVPRSAVGLE